MCATSMCYMLMSLRQKLSPKGAIGSPPQCSDQLKSDVAVFGKLMRHTSVCIQIYMDLQKITRFGPRTFYSWVEVRDYGKRSSQNVPSE